MPSLVALSQAQWAVLGVSLILFISLFQWLRVRTAVAQRQHDGWHALPESSSVMNYRASGCEDRFIADLTDHFPGKFSDEDRLQMRLFLQGLPDDFMVFLQLDPVQIYRELNQPGSIAFSHLPPQQDFWIKSPLSSGSEMSCYQSVFTIPPERYLGYDPEERTGRKKANRSRHLYEVNSVHGCQRLVFAHPEEDGRDDTILAFVPKYVIR